MNKNYWELMETFAGLNEAQDPELETRKWKAKQAKEKKAQAADKYKRQSILTPDYLHELPAKHGFDSQSLKGGDLDAAKADLIQTIDSHDFRDKKHRNTAMNIIDKSGNMQQLWLGMFNFMRAMTHPTEKISSVK